MQALRPRGCNILQALPEPSNLSAQVSLGHPTTAIVLADLAASFASLAWLFAAALKLRFVMQISVWASHSQGETDPNRSKPSEDCADERAGIRTFARFWRQR